MIVVTGAAGFIGSAMISFLNKKGITDIIAIDDFSSYNKNKNLASKKLKLALHRDEALSWMQMNATSVEAVFHIGARTDTTEFNQDIFDRLNINYSRKLWELCTQHGIPLIYASSAATYGAGENGYTDTHEGIPDLQPLNPYGWSKQIIDQWVLEETITPPSWYGFKFFNVYGPNEYHKGRMASVVFHACNQIRQTGKMKLFRSHRPDIADGYQSRDFIYIQDVIETLYWFYEHKPANGIYNLGTGLARPFLHLTQAVFDALDMPENIEYIDTPDDIRDTYQYFTQASMEKVKSTGCPLAFHSLEDGVATYVRAYLLPGQYY